MAATSGLTTAHFKLRLMTPAMVTDRWVGWTRDPVLMAQLNSRLLNLSRIDIQGYVANAIASKRAIIGIFSKRNDEHVGLYEAVADPQHRNVTIDVLVDREQHDLQKVLRETDPVLLADLRSRFKMEKAVTMVVGTYLPAIRHFESTGWNREGVLREDYPSADGTSRVDVVQFGKELI